MLDLYVPRGTHVEHSHVFSILIHSLTQLHLPYPEPREALG